MAEHGRTIPEEKKVEDLIDGINVQNSYLNAAIANIRTSDHMAGDFAKAMDYLALTVQKNKKSLNRRAINEVKTDKSGKKKVKIHSGKYSLQEWANLTKAQREQVRNLRKELGKKRKAAAAVSEKDKGEDSDSNAGDQMSRNKKGKHQHE